MLHDVVHRLGHDPVGRHLDRCRQVGHPVGVDGDRDLGPDPLGLLLQGGAQSQVVQGRRSQVVHEPSYVVQGVAHLRPGQPDQVARGVRVGTDRVAGRVQPHRHPAERGSEPVVQVAADPATVLLPAQHQPLPGLLERVGEQAAAHGDRGLAHQVDEEVLVAARQHRAQAPLGQDELADPLLVVADVQLLHLPRRLRAPRRRPRRPASPPRPGRTAP